MIVAARKSHYPQRGSACQFTLATGKARKMIASWCVRSRKDGKQSRKGLARAGSLQYGLRANSPVLTPGEPLRKIDRNAHPCHPSLAKWVRCAEPACGFWTQEGRGAYLEKTSPSFLS